VVARFYFGAMSPYSWFAAERIGALLPDAIWRPVFAGGLFKAAGRTSWGLTDDRAWKLADCEQRAREHGLGEIVWPDPWPTVDVVATRAMVVADRHGALQPFALTLMRLAFKEGHDLGDPASAAEAARRTGLDAPALLEAIQTPKVKDEVRAITAEATALGIIGVPTVEVDGELFWGDDRLAEAAGHRAEPRGEPAAC
jgi:2-hydroxychromene-2-carboxylate isomerase